MTVWIAVGDWWNCSCLRRQIPPLILVLAAVMVWRLTESSDFDFIPFIQTILATFLTHWSASCPSYIGISNIFKNLLPSCLCVSNASFLGFTDFTRADISHNLWLPVAEGRNQQPKKQQWLPDVERPFQRSRFSLQSSTSFHPSGFSSVNHSPIIFVFNEINHPNKHQPWSSSQPSHS